jgi:hypothetical protein
MLRRDADQRKVILGHAEERGSFGAGRLLVVKAVTDGDEGGIGIDLEFDCAACALSQLPFQREKHLSRIAPSDNQNFITARPTIFPVLSRSICSLIWPNVNILRVWRILTSAASAMTSLRSV